MHHPFCRSSPARIPHIGRTGLLTGGSLLALALFALTGCSPAGNGAAVSKKGDAGPPVPVLAAPAVATNLPVLVTGIGNVVPSSKVTIRSQVTGKLLEVHFKEGQEVHAGDLLFTLDPRPAQAALAQAQANYARDTAQLENVKLQYDRQEKLFHTQLISQEDFDNARATLDAQQSTVLADAAAITNATLNLDYTSIRSSVTGIAGAQQVYPGNIVKSPDDTMLIINQIHPIEVAFSVPERYLPEIRAEMRQKKLTVAASYAGLIGPAPQGDLTFVDNTVDPTTGTIQLKGTFSNLDNTLWPGQFVTVALTLSELTNAVAVPSQAIQTGQNGEYVFVIKSDQTVELRPVTIGLDHAGLTEVTDGLHAGETVVTDGQLRLKPGSAITRTAPPSAADTATNAVAAQP